MRFLSRSELGGWFYQIWRKARVSDENEQRKGEAAAALPENYEIPLETLQDARRALALLTNQFRRKEIPEGVLRACTYSLNGLVKCIHLEKIADHERRIRVLEAKE
jgi:hypothetical protein